MAKPTVDELMAADSWLNRSLAACVAVFLAGAVWLYLQSHDTRATDTGVMGIVFFVLGMSRPSGAFIGLGAAFIAIAITRKRRRRSLDR